MGNCIGTAFALSHHDDKKVSSDEKDQDLKASAMAAGKINSGPCNGWETSPVSELCRGAMPLAVVLKTGEVCRVIPDDSCNGHRMKIVVNKKQLQLLMRSVEELKSRHVVIQSIKKRGKKWRPSLATIPEL